MSTSHGNKRFDIWGNPQIDKLYNDRYRIVVRAKVSNKDRDWWYSNRDNFWKSLGSSYGSEITVDGASTGWEPSSGEEYSNAKLIRVQFTYPQGQNFPVLEFVYETLGATFAQERDDQIDYELNGLKRLTRTVIAQDGTAYSNVVGTTTLDSAGTTLTLASVIEPAKNEDEGGYEKRVETWVEAGVLRTSKTDVGEGAVKVTQTNLISTPSLVGTQVSSSTDNVEGLQTNTVSVMQDPNGNDITSSTTTFFQYQDFRHPGQVDISSVVLNTWDQGGATVTNSYFKLWPPITKKLKHTIEVSYQNNTTLNETVYNVSNWARGSYYGIGRYGRGFHSTQSFVGYVVKQGATLSSALNGGDTWTDNIKLIHGERVYGGTIGYIQIEGGQSGFPTTEIIVDARLSYAFTDKNGTKFYKKVVTKVTPEALPS